MYHSICTLKYRGRFCAEMIKIETKSARIARAIVSIFNDEIDYFCQYICDMLRFKWYM